MNQKDILLPFQLESTGVRGRLVRLGSSITEILRQHDYPSPVAGLLAETAALAAAMASALKFEGIFTLQAKGSGAVSSLVADVTSEGAVRAYAQFDAEKIAGEGAALLGGGHLVFTVDQTLKDERYQGIVKLEGESLTEAFQAYFRQSEQIPTGLVTASRQDEAGAWRAACLMLQQMPREGGEAVCRDTSVEDDWLRVMTLMQTCTKEELTDFSLAGEDLLYRLFHEEGVRAYESKTFHHACRCSREKIAGVLQGLPLEERKAALKDGPAEATCQFCGKTYRFTERELTAPHDPCA